ncbi:hypothetical protein GH714_013414 [Hevea brasiliensis]|uniref:EGF-like domain-containing protein n=1 Tax=Hevea brasiliensis TaxID=3981 RepID=A0A6A6NCP3_HEVBR|nr:hypothetical protein GH714_013414 [Hevea brasiliensis]
MLSFWLVFLSFTSPLTATGSPDAVSGCPDTCGNVHVPYPFGINFTSEISKPRCALNNSEFMFICNSTYNPPQLFFGENMPIHHISVEEGTISVKIYAAYNCYNNRGLFASFSQSISLGNGLFRFSDSRNKLTVVGCDTLALMEDATETFGSGCLSWCETDMTLQGSCSGFGCCQTSIPKSLKTLNISLSSSTNHSRVLQFNPCDFAFLSDERTYNVSSLQLSYNPFSSATENFVTSDVVIEWVVREETCEVARSSSNPNGYACGDNSKCLYSVNGQGYRCLCNDGFTGNPYLPQGCQDIDECKEPDKYKCDGTCKNTFGAYTCRCPLGMLGDGKVACRGFRVTTIAAVTGAILLIMVIAFLIIIIYKRRRKERNFLENGGMLLKHQRVRIFSEAELVKATKNFDASHLLGEGGFGYVYRGFLADNTQEHHSIFLSSLENHTLHRILRFNVASENEMEEIEVCAELAKQCLRSSGIQRPTMKEVAEELGRLRKLNRSSWDHRQSSQETEYLPAESSYSTIEVGTSKMSQNEILRLRTFDIEYSTDNI